MYGFCDMAKLYIYIFYRNLFNSLLSNSEFRCLILSVGKQIHKKGSAVTQLTCLPLNPDDALVILPCPDVHTAGCLSLRSVTAVSKNGSA